MRRGSIYARVENETSSKSKVIVHAPQRQSCLKRTNSGLADIPHSLL